MTKKSTKRAMLFSVLSLVLCMSMFVGTTYAWFTDSVTSANNIIQSGNLDMKVSYRPYGADHSDEWTEVTNTTKIFKDGALYEPGYTEAIWLKVENLGSLAFRYKMFLSVLNETEGVNQAGNTFKLSDYLVVKAQTIADVDGWESFYEGRDDFDNFAFKDQKLSDVVSLANNNVIVADGEPLYALVVVSMPTTVGNDANHNGKNVPSIEFSLNAVATQVTAEKDSFGNDYDAGSDFVAYFDNGTHTVNSVLLATSSTDVITAVGADTIVNINGGYYDSGSQECVVWAYDGAVVNIYDGTFVCDGYESTNSGSHQDMIYAGSNGGKINIYGGFFSSRSEAWLLNEKDNQGEITVTGGTFVNWNPANNVSEGKNTNFVDEGYVVVAEQHGDDTWYTVVAKDSILVAKNGSLELEDDVTIFNAPVYSNHTATEPVTINGNGNTVTGVVTSVDVFQWDGNIPLVSNIFSSANGAKVTVNDLNFTGTMSAIMLGNYVNSRYNNFNTEFNNVKVTDAEVVSFSPYISPAVCVYGTAVLNNCEITGTKLSALDTDDMWPVYDMAVVNFATATLNNSDVGSIYMWQHANVVLNNGSDVEDIYATLNGLIRGKIVVNSGATVGKITIDATNYPANPQLANAITIAAGASVDTIEISNTTSTNLANVLNIDANAKVNTIIVNGTSYTLAEWLAVNP